MQLAETGREVLGAPVAGAGDIEGTAEMAGGAVTGLGADVGGAVEF